MPDAQPVENHRTIDYALNFHDDQAQFFRVEPEPDGRKVIVRGICPGCGGRTRTVWPTGIGSGSKGTFTGSGEEAAARIPDRNRLVRCECGLSHPNRPATELFTGCGANWHVEMP
ncbi:hypothetical protein [Actinoplanes sp. L3-i22]|uniref:hypothetical protein n=1 Tax=Actinoplanes sp. L3-i22 TaxID=2836373 RepID=UPI001C77533D|nr:hypothetical protein [Actinoplanes sp. L3-i22]BCY08268.1 hypothetical protein L3i22_033560 [Actinoplanes sp. L3-i22]